MIGLELYEALTRTELYLVDVITNSKNEYDDPKVLNFRKWIVKMWHFGVDTLDEYAGKEFEVTFEEGMSDLYRIYTKRMKNGRKIIRVEHQECPNQKSADAFVRKLFPNGKLAKTDDMDNNI